MIERLKAEMVEAMTPEPLLIEAQSNEQRANGKTTSNTSSA
jgi:hypothetical protein